MTNTAKKKTKKTNHLTKLQKLKNENKRLLKRCRQLEMDYEFVTFVGLPYT